MQIKHTLRQLESPRNINTKEKICLAYQLKRTIHHVKGRLSTSTFRQSNCSSSSYSNLHLTKHKKKHRKKMHSYRNQEPTWKNKLQELVAEIKHIQEQENIKSITCKYTGQGNFYNNSLFIFIFYFLAQ